MKRATITIEVKDSDGWAELFTKLGIPQDKWSKHLKYGEYATLELEFNERLSVTIGRIVPRKP